MTPQNVIELGFNEDDLTQEQSRVIKLLTEVYDLVKKLDGIQVSPIKITGFSELNKIVKEQSSTLLQLNKTMAEYQKQQILAAKAEEALAKAKTATNKQLESEVNLKKKQTATNDAANREKQKELSLVDKVSNEYLQLSLALKDAEDRYKNLYLVAGKNATATQAALKEVLSTRAIIDNIDRSIGNYHRNVGNYASAFTGLNFSVQQILREAPAAAVSLNTFFLAISNNLPILFDEIQRANASLKTFKDASENATAQLALQTTAQKEAIAASEAATIALDAEIEAAVGKDALLKDQVVQQAALAKANTESAEAIALQTEELLVNAGVAQKDATSIKALIVQNAKLTSTVAKTTIALESQAAATAEVVAAENAQPSVTKRIIGSLFSLNTVLTLGVLGLTLFGGKIVKFIGDLIKGGDALDTMKKNMENVNEVMSNANKDAGEQITNLKLLYNAATDVSLADKDRKDAAIALQQTYPETFKNFNTEQIELGEAKDGYDKLTKSIIDNAKAKAAKAKIDDLEAQRLDILFQKQKIINATTAEAARVNKQNLSDQLKSGTQLIGGLSSTTSAINSKAEQLLTIQNRKFKALREQDLKDASLEQQEKFLINFVGEANITKVVEDEFKKRIKKQKEVKDETLALLKELIEAEIAQQQLIVDNADVTYHNYQERYNATKRIAELQQELSDAIVKNDIKNKKDRITSAIEEGNRLVEIAKKTNDNISKIEIDRFKFSEDSPLIPPIEDDEAARLAAAAKKVFEDINKGIEAALADRLVIIQTNQEIEEKNLKENYNAKEITTREFEKKLADIRTKYSKEALEAQIHAAESQLVFLDPLSDAYRQLLLNIAKARNALQDFGNTDTNGLKQMADDLEEINQIMQNLTQAFTAVANISLDNQKVALEEIGAQEEKNYEKQHDNIQDAILTDQERADQLKIIDSEHERRQEEIARKQRVIDNKKAEFDKAANIANIITTTALAVVKALATGGVFAVPLAIAIGALGAAQLAAAVATKVPHYAEGIQDVQHEHVGLVGEAGAEKVKRPGMRDVIFNKPTLVKLPKHSSVIPLKDSINSMANRAIGNGLLVYMNADQKDESWDIAKWQVNQMKKMQPKRVSNSRSYDFQEALYIAKNIKHTA